MPVPNLAVIHQEYRTGQVSKRFEIMVSQTWQPKQQQAGQQTLVEERLTRLLLLPSQDWAEGSALQKEVGCDATRLERWRDDLSRVHFGGYTSTVMQIRTCSLAVRQGSHLVQIMGNWGQQCNAIWTHCKMLNV